VKLGRLGDARDPLERAVREFPKDATVLEHLGDYYDRTGDAASAKVFWRRALEAIPETPEAPGVKESLQRKLDKAPVASGPPGNQAAVVPPGP
jgi:tetratricopeptide (TPR) repeat protein